MRQKRSRNKFRDYLPDHVGDSFLTELRTLVEELGTADSRGRYLAQECFSKYTDLTTTSADVRRTAAIQKWLATEERNALTNQRLQLADEDEVFSFTSWFKLRDKVRSLVSDVLGPLRYPAVLWDGTIGNGASTRVKRSPRAAIDKLTGTAHSSMSALQHWSEATKGLRLEDQTVELQESSVLFTVPKSTDIDRVACKEPEINMFLQRSVGNHIRRRLRKYGVDLNDQSRNRDLARSAVRRHLATIDLSSASDSISGQLVFELLPFEWWSLLDDLRVKETLVDGEVHILEMFSSMGNGFTFELESLLFYAVTRAVCWLTGTKGTVSVYGDDIIAPIVCLPALREAFDFLGFTMNPKKTHALDLFRESCGGHYLDSVDVTPFYVRRPVRTLSDLIQHLNQLLKWDSAGWHFFTTNQCAVFHAKWAKHVPLSLHGGPDVDSNDSLVTGCAPRSRILRKTDEVRGYDPTAALTLWLQRQEARREVGPMVLTPEMDELPKWSSFVDPSLVTPFRQGRANLARFPDWTERTTYNPYLITEVE